MRIWLTFALLCAVAGCAGDHQFSLGTDAGGIVDGGWHSTPVYDASAAPDAFAPGVMCHAVPITTAHVPDAVAGLRYAPVHLVSQGGSSTSCACTPRGGTEAAGSVITLSACDCCLDCDCIDFGYEATLLDFVSEGIGHGTTITLSVGPDLSTTIVDPARCIGSSATVTEIVALGPSDRLRQGQPRSAWVDLRAFDARCCGEPLELVTPTLSADGTTIDLTLAECRPDPCDCSSDEPHDASTPVYLGDLAPGTYTVRAAAVSTTITIP
jgi:hypothetical protein